MEKNIRIGIDCRLAGHKHAGIGRYIQNLVIRLPLVTKQVEWVYFFFDQTQADEILQLIPSSVRVRIQVVLAPYRHYSVSEQLFMPGVFDRAHLSLLHVPHFNVPLLTRTRVVVTIHDLLWHEYQGTAVTTLPRWQYWLKYQMYRYTVAHAVQQAKHILVPADTIRQTVSRYYPQAAQKISITKNGIDDTFRVGSTAQKSFGRSAAQSAKTFVYVGSLYPHKNVRLVIDSLPQLAGYTLQIASARNVFQEQLQAYVKEKKLTDRVKFLGYVPDEKIVQLFQNCTALVQPSFSEGFGLTGAEAMVAGLPVLASSIPIFQEIYQDAALYFDPHSSESFIAAVHQLEKSDRSAVIKRGLKVTQQYSWQKMAEQTWDVYQKIL